MIIAVALVLGTLTAFVYPLIVDRQLSAVEAIKLSFRAVMGNFFGVVGLMIVGQIIMIAGLMFFYVGALFVAPIIFAAWAVAYRRVFPAETVPYIGGHMNGMPHFNVIPPISTSKAGWILTLSSLLIIGLGFVGISMLTYMAYSGISRAIERTEEQRKTREINTPNNDDWYAATPTPNQTPTTQHPSTDKTISGDVLNGKAVELPKPAYPASAKAVKASGAVNVQVTVDENGKVIFAAAVSGHPLLRQSAEQAARNAKFNPTLLRGKAVKVRGIIVYNFVP